VLSSENRLRKDTDIKTLFSKGKGVFDSVCGLKFRPNGLTVSRFAIVAGTTVSKRAVVRNKLRRQLREILRSRLSHIRPGFDIVLIVRKPAIEKTFEYLVQTVEGDLKRGRLWI
jgi:ribonuclease P protein component